MTVGGWTPLINPTKYRSKSVLRYLRHYRASQATVTEAVAPLGVKETASQHHCSLGRALICICRVYLIVIRTVIRRRVTNHTSVCAARRVPLRYEV